MIAHGKYKHSFLENTWAEVIDGDDEVAIYLEDGRHGVEKKILEVDLFNRLYSLPEKWTPNPHAVLLKMVSAKLDEDPTVIDKLMPLIEKVRSRVTDRQRLLLIRKYCWGSMDDRTPEELNKTIYNIDLLTAHLGNDFSEVDGLEAKEIRRREMIEEKRNV